jgi:hypothetical protein
MFKCENIKNLGSVSPLYCNTDREEQALGGVQIEMVEI